MMSFEVATILKQEEFPYLISLAFYDSKGKRRLLKTLPTKGKNLSQLEKEYTPIVTTDDLLWSLGENLYAIGQTQPNHWEAVDRGDRGIRGKGGSIEDALAMLWLGMKKAAEGAVN